MSTLYQQNQQSANDAANTLRDTLATAFKSAGWFTITSENWAKTLWVTQRNGEAIHDAVADIVVRVGRRDYSTAVEVEINPRWRITRKTTFWATQKDGYTFTPEKVAKVVAKVQAVKDAIDAKAKTEALHAQWKAESEAKQLAWLKPIVDHMNTHGLKVAFTNDTRIKELGVGTLKLDGLSQDQMLGILDVLKKA